MVLLQCDEVITAPISTSALTPVRDAVAPLVTSLASLPNFLHTLYLFTANDFATFAIPTTLFAIFGSLSGSILTTNASPSLLLILLRMPIALLNVWFNLLIFNISNQRSPSAVEEDKINKPHRPLPSGRITPEDARKVLLVLIPCVLLLAWALGCWQESLLLFTFTWMYNDLGGCDDNWVLRNLLIAVGYGLYSSAALRVMVGPEHGLAAEGTQWVGLITVVMFITQHICDIKDAEGDRLRGRRSAPIVLGDELVRWSVAIPTSLCSIACPAFFDLGRTSYVLTFTLGSIVAIRTLVWRDLKSDKLTWKLWALWTCSLFALPLVANPAVFARYWGDLMRLFCPGGDCSGSLNLVAVSGVALAVEGRRVFGQIRQQGNATVPEIRVEGVII